MTEQANDYSLLRPFDAEKAKAGEAICCELGVEYVYGVGPDIDGDFCVFDKAGMFIYRKEHDLRMAPLFWLEGKPVYRGDAVLHTRVGSVGTVFSLSNTAGCVVVLSDVGRPIWSIEFLKWPDKKRQELLAIREELETLRKRIDEALTHAE